MADYYAETAIEQRIPIGDMTPLERLLLENIFEVSEENFHWALYSSEGPLMYVVVDRQELLTALKASSDYTETVAYVAVTAILEARRPSTVHDAHVDLDLSETSWDLILQDVLKRSTTLAYLTAITSFHASKPRLDGLGGMVVLITRDSIVGKSTSDILEELLNEAGLE